MTKYDFYWNYVERPKRIFWGHMHKIFKWNNERLIQREVDIHRNELVLDYPFEVVKLLGWTDQYDDDYYWVIYRRRVGIVLYSCVGGFIWLKKSLSGFDYYRMVNNWDMNTVSDDEMLQMVKDKGIILK